MHQGIAFRLGALSKAAQKPSMLRMFAATKASGAATAAKATADTASNKITKGSLAGLVAKTHNLSVKESTAIVDTVFNTIEQVCMLKKQPILIICFISGAEEREGG